MEQKKDKKIDNEKKNLIIGIIIVVISVCFFIIAGKDIIKDLKNVVNNLIDLENVTQVTTKTEYEVGESYKNINITISTTFI